MTATFGQQSVSVGLGEAELGPWLEAVRYLRDRQGEETLLFQICTLEGCLFLLSPLDPPNQILGQEYSIDLRRKLIQGRCFRQLAGHLGRKGLPLELTAAETREGQQFLDFYVVDWVGPVRGI